MPVYNGTLHYIDEKEARRYAGLARSADFPDKLISEACLEAQLLAAPQGNYEYYPYDCISAVIQSTPPLALTGGVIEKHLADCQQVAVLAVTIGSRIEAAISQHFAQGQYTAAILLDAAATAAVEMVADQVNALIDRQAAKLGCRTTRRFSPGYGNWAVTAQAAVTNLACGQAIGLSVTETSMLEPRKSVTAIVGLAPVQQPGNSQPSGCQSCQQPNCPSRKIFIEKEPR